jgi:hypothetical protein
VCNLIDVKGVRDGRDVTRLRSLLLLLKQNPVDIHAATH